jgi:ABC-type uncharacterized transport system permease subunit
MSVAVRARRAARPAGRLAVEQRGAASPALKVGVAAISVAAALAVGAVLLAATGEDPVTAYRALVDESLGSPQAFALTLVQTTPLILTGLAAAVAFRMRLWSIGADGQLVAGAILAAGVALKLGETSAIVAIPAALAAGVLGGALWALIPAVTRAYARTDEVVSTLMLNFVALALVDYLIVDSNTFLRDQANLAQPQGALLPDAVLLPLLFEDANIGVLIAIAVAVGVWFLFRFTTWGLGTQIVGDSTWAAAYAGIDARKAIVTVMLLSGALAGLAGAIQVTNVTLALDKAALSPGLGLGYTGIVVAALARLSPLAIVPVAFLMAALLNAGPGLDLVGVNPSVVVILQGLILLLVVAGQFLLSYRVRRRARPVDVA